MNAETDRVSETIMRLCTERGPGKTICPTEAAKALGEEAGGDDLAWREWLAKVRTVAVGLAREGRIVIYRKGKPVDPDSFRGVIRLGLPRSD